MVHKLPLLLHPSPFILTAAATDAQASCGPPEVAPAPSENTSLHGLRRWEEAEDVPKYAVRQGVDAASAAER
jgi:hypothetical protein